MKQLYDVKSHGYITEVTSLYGSVILFVPKTNKKLRMVVDYRPINKLTVVCKYPLPRIYKMLNRVGDARYFSKLYLHSGFYQIRVFLEHVERIAIRPSTALLRTWYMPFGLCNAPATF